MPGTSPAMTSHAIDRRSTRLTMIDAVRPHIGRGGDAVGHIEKSGDGGDVPNVAIGKSGAAQARAILLLHEPRLAGEFDGKIEHSTLAPRQPRCPVIHDHEFAKRRIA